MRTEQPNRQPEAANKQPYKAAARTAQHDELTTLRLRYPNHVDAGHVVPLFAAAVHRPLRRCFGRRTWQPKIAEQEKPAPCARGVRINRWRMRERQFLRAGLPH